MDILKEKYKAKIASTRGRKDRDGNPILFKLTYEEWVSIWQEAGVMPGRNWVLSRCNDCGHYELGNVFVQHNIQNVCDTLGLDSEYEQRVTELAIKTGYKRIVVRRLLKQGKLSI